LPNIAHILYLKYTGYRSIFVVRWGRAT